MGQIGDVTFWCYYIRMSIGNQYRWCLRRNNHHIRIHHPENPSKVPKTWFWVWVRSTEVSDLRWPFGVTWWCAQSCQTMPWPKKHERFSFVSMTSRLFMVKRDFTEKSAGGCTSYDVIAPWPDLTRSIFFSPKYARRLPHSLCQTSSRSAEPFRNYRGKTSGGGRYDPPPWLCEG